MKEITPVELKKWKDAGETFQLVDVREPYEAERCNIGGTLIPLGEVVERLSEIRKDIPVVVHCNSGGRSSAVIQALSTRYGFDNLVNLTGGIKAYGAAVAPELQCD
ncbi:MAG TPA: rhodanese-like domain-containing protein [Flavobacteriales bacterium]|nr:rhodanese-like domain-containing protein [Flavobacteriales bacterium]